MSAEAFVSGRPLGLVQTGNHAPLERGEVEELVEARELIEAQLAGMAAERGTPEQIARLRGCLDQMEVASASPLDYPDADVDFHLALAEAAGNRYLLRAMLDFRRFGDLSVSVESHRTLVDAVEAGNVDAARETAAKIVRRNREFVLGLYAMGPPVGTDRNAAADHV